MYRNNDTLNFTAFLRQRPRAWASLTGSPSHPTLRGSVRFYETPYGTLVVAEVMGLPTGTGCRQPIFGFHIHEGGQCRGNGEDPFAAAKTHYNPAGCPHPYHAGDMPPLLGANGYAYSAFLTDRFSVKEILGKTVIVHGSPDDFTTQPSGNAGVKIACGEIRG